MSNANSETTGWKRITHRHYQKTIDGVAYEIVRPYDGLWQVLANKVKFDYASGSPDAKRAAHKHARERA